MCVSEGGSEGEEEAWLVAMEKGQLDETGYVPQRPGTSLTTRQVPLVSPPHLLIFLTLMYHSYFGP